MAKRQQFKMHQHLLRHVFVSRLKQQDVLVKAAEATEDLDKIAASN